MDDFTKYASLRRDGTGAEDAYLIAKRDGLDLFGRIRMLRSVYGLSLESAKRISVEADTGESYEDVLAKLADALKEVLDEEFDPKNG
jgi:hypothetical protein